MCLLPFLLVSGCISDERPGNPIRASTEPSTGVLVVVLDGVRSDYVTPEPMPNLYRVAAAGFASDNHNSVFPTLTRVNAASYVTGAYPARHGIMGNRLFLPEVNSRRVLSTSDAQVLMEAERRMQGKLLTAPSLGEILHAAGSDLTVFRSGSSGSAFLLNHKGTGGGIVHPRIVRPQLEKREVLEKLGPAPNRRRVLPWLVDGVIDSVVSSVIGNVHFLWITEPDHAAHRHGVGSPPVREALRRVDALVRQIFDSLEKAGVGPRINVLVTSDHGFSTHREVESVRSQLVQAGLKESNQSTDIVVAGSANHVHAQKSERTRAIVEFLQRRPEIGAIFTAPAAPGDPDGAVEGTLSLDAIHGNHPDRAGDIRFSMNWSDEPNEHGYSGSTFSSSSSVAGHGSASRYEIGTVLIASGPQIKRKARSSLPTSAWKSHPRFCICSACRFRIRCRDA